MALFLCVPAGAQEAQKDMDTLAMKAVLGRASSDTTSVKAQALLPLGDDVFVVGCIETAAGESAPRVDSVVAVRMRKDGSVVSRKAGPSALPGETSTCQGVGVVGQPTPAQPWPLLELRYRSRHNLAAGTAIIEWSAVVDAGSMRLVRRVPTRLGLKRTDGTARLEMFETGVVSDTTAELKARTTGRKVLVPCAAVCVVEPATVLELAAE